MNVYAPFFERAREAPDAPAVLTPEGQLTYSELARAVAWTGAAFRRAGVGAGDHVAIALGNQAQYLVSSLALAAIGAGQLALRPSDPVAVREDLDRKLGLIGTVAMSDAAVIRTRIEPPPARIAELRALGGSSCELSSDGSLPFLLKRSSGTTRALAKVSILTHAMGVAPADAFPRDLPRAAACRYLPFSPLSFATSMNRVPPLLSDGSCLALAEGISEATEMAEFIKKHDINSAGGGPTHAMALLEAAEPGKVLLPNVALRVSSTFVHEEVRRAILQRLTPRLYVTYAAAETGSISAATPAHILRRPGTVGYALPGVEVAIVNEEGSLASVGIGRLRVRTPWMARGYVDEPDETARAFRAGWFQTGDRVEICADGELIHHGRADDLMIYDGMNIEPGEIEQALLRHPAVAEAAAFGIPSKIRGSIPAVAVVLARQCSLKELRSHCGAWLGLKAPVTFLVLQSLPRTAMGKVLRRELLARYQAARATRSES